MDLVQGWDSSAGSVGSGEGGGWGLLVCDVHRFVRCLGIILILGIVLVITRRQK